MRRICRERERWPKELERIGYKDRCEGGDCGEGAEESEDNEEKEEVKEMEEDVGKSYESGDDKGARTGKEEKETRQ